MCGQVQPSPLPTHLRPPNPLSYLVRQNAAPDLGRRLLGQRPRHKFFLVGQQLGHDFRRLRRGRQRAADQSIARGRRAARAGGRQGGDRGLQAGGGVGSGAAVAAITIIRLAARLASGAARVGAPPPGVLRAPALVGLPPSQAPVQDDARVVAAACDGVLQLGVHARRAGDAGHAGDAQRDLFVVANVVGKVDGGGVEHGGERSRLVAGDGHRRVPRHRRRRRRARARTIVAIIRRRPGRHILDRASRRRRWARAHGRRAAHAARGHRRAAARGGIVR